MAFEMQILEAHCCGVCFQFLQIPSGCHHLDCKNTHKDCWYYLTNAAVESRGRILEMLVRERARAETYWGERSRYSPCTRSID